MRKIQTSMTLEVEIKTKKINKKGRGKNGTLVENKLLLMNVILL